MFPLHCMFEVVLPNEFFIEKTMVEGAMAREMFSKPLKDWNISLWIVLDNLGVLSQLGTCMWLMSPCFYLV